MKILQIGVGNFGKNHLRILRELKQEVYVADLSTENLNKATDYGIPKEKTTIDYTKFLAKVDAVIVATPTDSHYPICKEAIQAGKHVFVEKPMVSNPEEAKSLKHLVEKHKVILQVGHIFRFNPAVQFVKQCIDQKVIGKVRYLKGEFFGFKRCRTDVGVTATDAIHFIDLYNFWLDKQPDNVFASMQDNFGRGLDDTSTVILKYGDVNASVETGNTQPNKRRFILVSGSKANIELELDSQKVTIHNQTHELVDGVWQSVEKGSQVIPLTNQEPLALELKSFLDGVETKNFPTIDVEKIVLIEKIPYVNYLFEPKLDSKHFVAGVENGLKLSVIVESLYASTKNVGVTVYPGAIVRENVKIGKNVSIGNFSLVLPNAKISNDVKIHSHCVVAEYSFIGEGTWLGPGVKLYNSIHPKQFVKNDEHKENCDRLGAPTIGRFVRIGGGSIINAFVKIGDRAVIGAGSVVTKDVPSGMLVVGNPAKIVKKVKDITCKLDDKFKPYEVEK